MADTNEDARLDALYQLNLLDTPPSESFDRITRMATQLFGLPISAVSLTDRDRQWFKSRVGVEHMSIPREKAPCAQDRTCDVLMRIYGPCGWERWTKSTCSAGHRGYARPLPVCIGLALEG